MASAKNDKNQLNCNYACEASNYSTREAREPAEQITLENFL